MNKTLLKRIQDRLSSVGIRYSTNENTIQLGMNIGDLIGNVRIYIQVIENYILTYTIMNNKCPINQINKTAEYLHRANYGLINGNFEIDFNDGEIRYKTLTFCQNPSNISNELIDNCVILPCKMIEKYGKGIMKSILNEGNPEDLIKEAEQP